MNGFLHASKPNTIPVTTDRFRNRFPPDCRPSLRNVLALVSGVLLLGLLFLPQQGFAQVLFLPSWELNPFLGGGLISEKGEEPEWYGKVGLQGRAWVYRRWGLDGHMAYSQYKQHYTRATLDTLRALNANASSIPFDKRRVTEHRIDIKGSLAYQLLKGDHYITTIKVGYGQFYLFNSFSDFEIGGPLFGGGVDWQLTRDLRLDFKADVTANLVGSTTGSNRGVRVSGSTSPSLFGDAQYITTYQLTGTWNLWTWGSLQLGWDGTVLRFRRSTRTYNGLMLGIVF